MEESMHLPDAIISNPINITTAIISTSLIALSVYKIRKDELSSKKIPLAGVLTALVFAAQMLNFPILAGVSGHFLGGALIAILLGPWYALLILSVILILQCFGFMDGGVTALGSNIFNMGFIGGIVSYYIYRSLSFIFQRISNNRFIQLVPAGITAWLSVVLASSMCAIELIFSTNVHIAKEIIFGSMIGYHVIIGIGEAIITTTVLSLLYSVYPDLALWGKINKEVSA